MTDMFVTLPELQHIIDSTGWDVTNAAQFWSERFRASVTVTPPFRTDLASVPRFAWLLIPRDDKNIVEPAVFHDWLYANVGWTNGSYVAGPGKTFLLGAQFTRRQCDRVLSDAMKLAGAPWWKRHTVYLAVRLGGWKPWAAYKAKQS